MSATHAFPAVTDATFGSEVGPGSGHVAVEFTADWCGACRALAPVLDAVAQEYAPALRVFQVDADANSALVSRFGIRGLPTTLLFRDGQLVDTVVGAVPRAVLQARFGALVAG